jgi:uncharacterized protein YdeI (YjbR/CyaY-like superfamily)
MTQQIYAGTVKEWRDWLRKNHKKESKVYLIKYKKHTGKPSLNNKDAMAEAICFGWIDTTIKKLDEERYQQAFVRRNSKSRWSNNTLRYAREQIAKRRMSKFGMKMYLEGKQKPTIDHNLPKNPDTPEDLKKALGKHLSAFEKYAPSSRRLFIYQVMKAKRPETKEKWITWVVDKVAKGEKPY